MKLTSPLLSFLLNFLLGFAWAFAFASAIITFYLYFEAGIMFASFAALVATLPGLFFVLFIEYFFLKQEHLNELQKQTDLLEDLIARLQ